MAKTKKVGKVTITDPEITAAEKAVVAAANAFRAATAETDRASRYAAVQEANAMRASDAHVAARKASDAARTALDKAIAELPVPPRYADGGLIVTAPVLSARFWESAVPAGDPRFKPST